MLSLHVHIPQRYIEEHVQKTAVAIETQGFTLVTSGKRRESLTVRPAYYKWVGGNRLVHGTHYELARF